MRVITLVASKKKQAVRIDPHGLLLIVFTDIYWAIAR